MRIVRDLVMDTGFRRYGDEDRMLLNRRELPHPPEADSGRNRLESHGDPSLRSGRDISPGFLPLVQFMDTVHLLRLLRKVSTIFRRYGDKVVGYVSPALDLPTLRIAVEGKITLEVVAVADVDVWVVAAEVMVAGAVVFETHPVFNSTVAMRVMADSCCNRFIRFFIIQPPASQILFGLNIKYH